MRYRTAFALLTATALATGATASPLMAESLNSASIASVQVASQNTGVIAKRELAQFQPASDTVDHRIDYKALTEALEWMVIPMGPSIREGAPRVDANLGTRRIFGHTSRYRLEGNRVAFSFLKDEQRTGLTEYRKDLERVGTELDLARLPRNEQLAYWMNLHNVAILEALAYEYPLADSRQRGFGAEDAKLQDAKLVEVKGVALSARDIREKIVYPNWQDPKVIYGFWRGEIGGPSILRVAFTGSNVGQLLEWNANEFINSLRGVEKYSGALQLSSIYEEASPYFFENDAALRGHLVQFARDDVKRLIAKTDKTRFKSYEHDIADLVRGHSDPGLTQFAALVDLIGADRQFKSYSSANGTFINPNSRIDPAIQRLVNERAKKLNKAVKRGLRTGTVIVGDGEGGEGEPVEEVE